MGYKSNQPLHAGGLTSVIKQKPYLAVEYHFCVNYEAAKWQQKKLFFEQPCILKSLGVNKRMKIIIFYIYNK
jgi:hypothetical protein